jgi:hypothetical protein
VTVRAGCQVPFGRYQVSGGWGPSGEEKPGIRFRVIRRRPMGRCRVTQFSVCTGVGVEEIGRRERLHRGVRPGDPLISNPCRRIPASCPFPRWWFRQSERTQHLWPPWSSPEILVRISSSPNKMGRERRTKATVPTGLADARGSILTRGTLAWEQSPHGCHGPAVIMTAPGKGHSPGNSLPKEWSLPMTAQFTRATLRLYLANRTDLP